MADTTPPTAKPESETPETRPDSVSSFPDDDLGRIQGILFGDHARKTEERLNVMEVALLGAIADLRAETLAKFDAVDAKITAESDTRERAVSNIGSRIGRDIAEQSSKVDDLRTEVASIEANAAQSIETVESTMKDSLAKAKDEASEDAKQMATAVTELKNNNVDRKDLARLLRELGDQFDT